MRVKHDPRITVKVWPKWPSYPHSVNPFNTEHGGIIVIYPHRLLTPNLAPVTSSSHANQSNQWWWLSEDSENYEINSRTKKVNQKNKGNRVMSQ